MSGISASSEYIGWRVEVFVGVFTALEVILVSLRFYARSLTASQYASDDWLVLAALLGQFVQAGIVIGSIEQGSGGYHVAYLEETRPEGLVLFSKYLVAVSIWYITTIWIAKLSICILYRRLFPQRPVIILLWVTVGVMMLTAIVTLIVTFLACRPFWTNWAPPDVQMTHCIDKEALFVWGTLPNVVTDIIMLAIPLPVVWKLQAATNLKIALTITFVIGSAGLVTSILRLRAFYTINPFVDTTYNAVELEIWTVLEPGLYLISACLLVYRPLLEKIRTGITFVRNKVTTLRTSGPRSENYQLGEGPYDRQHDKRQSNRAAGFDQLWDQDDNSQSAFRAHSRFAGGPTSSSLALHRDNDNEAGIMRTTVIQHSWDPA
ncbi:hypothetical protein F4861DRAFT_76473 [Xylaria intraflava]|nr:hypothetical protein F4861DRAFT_76473 [Xylaria intraflava]